MSGDIDGFISKSILKNGKRRAANFDWLSVPPERHLLPDSILSWVSDFEDISLAMTDADTENIPDVENPSAIQCQVTFCLVETLLR